MCKHMESASPFADVITVNDSGKCLGGGGDGDKVLATFLFLFDRDLLGVHSLDTVG